MGNRMWINSLDTNFRRNFHAAVKIRNSELNFKTLAVVSLRLERQLRRWSSAALMQLGMGQLTRNWPVRRMQGRFSLLNVMARTVWPGRM